MFKAFIDFTAVKWSILVLDRNYERLSVSAGKSVANVSQNALTYYVA